MKSIILFFILIAGVMNAGCSSLSKSNIFDSFSLQDTAIKAAYKNIDCAKGAGGDDAFSIEVSRAGSKGTSSERPSTIQCEVIESGSNRFSETDLFDALLSEVKKKIKVNGGTSTSSSRPTLNNLVVDYEVNGRQGKIHISGRRNGSIYELTSEIREWTK
jgi:hypothetical protein